MDAWGISYKQKVINMKHKLKDFQQAGWEKDKMHKHPEVVAKVPQPPGYRN